jgi:hypothetical protein
MNNFEFILKDENGNICPIDSTWYFNKVGAGIEIDISLDHNDIRLKTFITPSDPELFSVDKFETGEWLPDFVNNVIFHNDDKIYVVPLDHFGVRDLKFIIPCEEKELQIYMTTDVEVSEPSRPITFSNFEVFAKQDDNLIVECTVDFKGFNFTSHINGKGVKTERLNFINPLIGHRIAIYESDLYKRGCLDFHKFVKELKLWRVLSGWDDYSDLKRIKLHIKTRSFYVAENEYFSLMLFEDRRVLYFDIFTSIVERLASSPAVLKNTETDMELILYRWFNKNFVACVDMIPKLIDLDESINDLINASYKLRKYSVQNSKNDVLY